MTQAEIDDEAWNAATREFLKARDEEAKLECRFRIIIWGAAVLGALALVVAGYAYPALAHTHNGMKFDSFCCNGNTENGDCQEIPASAVTINSETGMVHVKLKPGDHPLVTMPHEYDMEYSKTRRSNNGLYYACLYPHQSILRCLYLPPESF